jgi:hypothetical protein
MVVVDPQACAGAALRVAVAVCSHLLAAAALLAPPAAYAAAFAAAGTLREAVVSLRTPPLLLPATWRLGSRSRSRGRWACSADAAGSTRIRAEVVAAALAGVVGRLVVRNAHSAGRLLDNADAEADAVLAWTIGIFCAAGAWTDWSYFCAGAFDALTRPHVGTGQIVVADALADLVGFADTRRLPRIDDTPAVR